MDTPPPSTPPPPAASRVDRLLPVIRVIRERRSFRRDKVGEGVAVFREGILLFRAPRKMALPEAAYASDGGSALGRTPKIKVRKNLPMDSIATATVVRKGIFILVRGSTTRGEKFKFKAARQEAGHLVEVLAALLGSRLECAVTAADLAPPPAVRKFWSVLGASLLLLVGLVGVRFGWQQENEAGKELSLGSMFMMHGSLMAVYSLVFLGQAFITSSGMQRPVAHEPVRLPRFGLLLKIAGIGLFFSAHYYPMEVSEWLFSSRADAMDRSMHGGMVSFVLSLSGAVLLYLGYRFGLRGASSQEKGDTRAPAVYLRSFGDDGKNNLNPDTLTAKILGLRVWGLLEILGPIANLYPPRLLKLVLGSATDTAEEQLATFFRRQGPFVAIGKPGEWLATGGAERMYVSHDTWQDTVLGLLHRCATVVLQPARTEGVWWEIETCIRQVEPGRLLLSFAAYDKSPQAYEEFRLRFEDLSQVMLPRTLGGAHFIWIVPGGHAMVLPSRYRTPLLWPLLGLGLDLKATLWPFLHHVYPQDYPTAPAAERPVLFAAGKAAAIVAWSLLIFGGPMVFSSLHEAGRQFSRMETVDLVMHSGGSAGYLLFLPEDWKSKTPPYGCDALWTSPGDIAVMSIEVVRQFEGDTEGLARLALYGLDQQSEAPATELSRRTVNREGKDWLEVEVLRQIPGAAFTQHQILEFYSGAEGNFILCISAARINTALFPGRQRILRQLAEGFELPAPAAPIAEPATTPGTVLEISRYTLQPPAGWQLAPPEMQKSFAPDRLYEYGELSAAGFVVTIEPPLAAEDIPKDWAQAFKVQQEVNGGKNVRAGEVTTVQVRGLSWLQFQIHAQIDGVEATYLYALYLGKEGTCTALAWTDTHQLKTHQPRIQEMLEALQLHFE